MHKIKKLGEHAIFSNPMSKIACLPDFLIFSISLTYFNSKKSNQPKLKLNGIDR